MPFGIGIWEMLILLVVLLLVFGPKRLPEMGRQIGKGMREFKDSIGGDSVDEVAIDVPPAELVGAVPGNTVVPVTSAATSAAAELHARQNAA